VAPANVTYNVTTTLTVCPIAHPICATDVSGNKLYADYFNQLIGDLKTSALFLQNMNINNVRLNTTNPVLIVNDVVVPDITKLMASVTNSAVTGAASWMATYATPVNCFWQISDATTAPTFAALKGCTDPSWCGTSKVGPNGATISTTVLKAFTAPATYQIYMGCTNDIPLPQKQSAVRAVATFSTPAPPVVSPSTPAVVINSTTISSSFVNFSMVALILVLSMIFN